MTGATSAHPRRFPLATRLLVVLDVALLVVAVGALGLGRPDDPRRGPRALATLSLQGTASINSSDNSTVVADGDREVVAGDVVEIVTGGARLWLAGGGSIELRAGAQDPTGDSRLAVASVPVLLGGDALVVAPQDREVMIEAGGARMTLIDGAARVSRATGATFALYRGRAGLESGGRSLEGGLDPLRQVVVPAAGRLPLTASPLRFGSSPDPWDRRFLGEAIDLEATLERRSTGFTTSLSDDVATDIFFFQAVLPGLLQEPDFDQALLDEQTRPVGENLVGAAVALFGQGSDFAQRWHQVFGLREEGAGWGVVAEDQGSPRALVMDALDGAVNRSPLLFGAPSPLPVFRPVLPPPRPVRAPLSPLPAPVLPAPGPVRLPAEVPPAPPPPVLVPPQSKPETLLEPVVDPVVDLLEGVLDGLDHLTGALF